jgi:hypothetical protein
LDEFVAEHIFPRKVLCKKKRLFSVKEKKKAAVMLPEKVRWSQRWAEEAIRSKEREKERGGWFFFFLEKQRERVFFWFQKLAFSSTPFRRSAFRPRVNRDCFFCFPDSFHPRL